MKASVRRSYCSPSQIRVEFIEKPIPKENEVLIRVYATTVNRTDCANLTAKPFIMRFLLGFLKPRKIVLGTDFSGKVISVGKNVRSFRIGDRVFGFNDMGAESQAEYLTAVEENVYPIPNHLDYKLAASGLEGAQYAYSFIHKVKIHSGQHILINGATGGIGSALLQFVKQYQVTVSATCNTENIKLIHDLGADKVIDYMKEDFSKGDEKYDLIFDTVGKSTFGKCKPVLNANGIYISSELGPNFQNVYLPLLNSISNKKVIFPIPFDKKITIPYISKRLEIGVFKPVIDREYELDEISKAYEYVIEGKKTGNVLINIG